MEPRRQIGDATVSDRKSVQPKASNLLCTEYYACFQFIYEETGRRSNISSNQSDHTAISTVIIPTSHIKAANSFHVYNFCARVSNLLLFARANHICDRFFRRPFSTLNHGSASCLGWNWHCLVESTVGAIRSAVFGGIRRLMRKSVAQFAPGVGNVRHIW